MKACGVEIKSNEAIVCLMSLENDLFDLPSIRVPRVVLETPYDQEALQKFQFTFRKLMEDYGVEKVVIRERPTKGKFAGSAQGFKLESAIELIDSLSVELIRPKEIAENLKRSQVGIDFRDTGLKKVQERAFETIFAYFSR